MNNGKSNFDRRELERLRYAQGQMIRGRDFRDEVALADQRRWWHNRALHGAYGVAQGYRVELWPDAANPTAVKVLQERSTEVIWKDDGTPKYDKDGRVETRTILRPGVAYDSFGRELVIMSDHPVPLPQSYRSTSDGCRGLAPMILVVRYRGQGGSGRAGSLAGACGLGRSPAALGNVAFEWVSAAEAWGSVGDGVPIARIQCDTAGRIQLATASEFAPPLATPLARPYIGTGATKPGGTAWEWSHAMKTAFVRVDTSAASFSKTPCYFAILCGQALKNIVPYILCDRIVDPTSKGFTYILFDRDDNAGRIRGVLEYDEKSTISLQWIGLELIEDSFFISAVPSVDLPAEPPIVTIWK